MSNADNDPRFPAAHYLDGRDLKPPPPPCLWIRDLEDVFSERGKQVVAQIRATCHCEECVSKRKERQP